MNVAHHANLLIGNTETRDQLISILEKKHGITAQGNPDFYVRNYETFTIDDSRAIKALHNSRPTIESNKKDTNAGKKLFILTMNGITIEAQNSLLKLLEEPAEYAHFFLIIPSAHLLLPTVKSRLSIINDLNSSGEDSKASKLSKKYLKEIDVELLKEAESFLKATQTKQLDIIKVLTDAISKEKKTKQDAIDFISAVESILYENVGTNVSKKEGLIKNKKGLEAIGLARNYIHDRAPSVKMLLEYMALQIPNLDQLV